MRDKKQSNYAINYIADHFSGLDLRNVTTLEKRFPPTVRPDLEAALADLLAADATDVDFFGLHGNQYSHQILSFSSMLAEKRDPTIISPAQYMDIDVGGQLPARCITSGLWLYKTNGAPAGLLVSQIPRYEDGGVRVESIASKEAGGVEYSHDLLERLVKHLKTSSIYKGKTLSFATSRSYGGGLGALKVHSFPETGIEDVILPKEVLDRLDRTVFQFVKQSKRLKEHGFSSKRGVLLYGPPGTGKTHYIKHCLSHLSDYTTFLVTAEQVAFITDIMIIARALQPSLIVIEDADLIARSRNRMDDACQEILLNKLLNEMDGLTEDSEFVFILTTNRPEEIEEAIKNRPGRIDQAIEIPKPDDECRKRLLNLYKGGSEIPEEIIAECVKRTQGVTASFMKELARRMVQFTLLREHDEQGKPKISEADMIQAFDDMFAEGTKTAEYL